MSWMRTLLTLFLLTPLAPAADWPQWLGPNRDNSSTEKVAVWKEAPKVLWRQAVGEGNSSPVIAGGRVFVHSKVKDKTEEEVIAYDARTGTLVWRQTYSRAAFKSPYGNGPRATPAVVDGKVYTFGITGVLTCWEADGGKQVWQVDTLKEFGARNLFFGMACSPLVEGDSVLVNIGGKGNSIVALDRHKGSVVWKSRDDRASYSSPIAFGQGAQRQVVFLTGDGVVSLNPKDGSTNWQFPLVDKLFESSTTPVRVGDQIVASAITYGSVGLKLTQSDGKIGYKEEWKNPALTSYFSTPVPVGKNYFFMVTGTNPQAALFQKPEATLHCIESATGKELWKQPKVGTYHAALLRTGDNKLLCLDDFGFLSLLEPDPKEYRQLCKAKVGTATWAHPALSDGRVYVRDEKQIICLQVGE
jgi:outer membrane protein assembly factor BamB